MSTHLAQYEIGETLGVGGMATVHCAYDRRLQRQVALKVMHPHLRGAREARVRFAREARTVARLRHPGIIAIFDYSGEDSEESYIATELLTGPTLKQYVTTQPPLPPEVAVCMALSVVEALAAAHAQGVIHRDVKPENVLLHEKSQIKLSDFGIAHLAGGQSVTATGQILGSPGHMAPEHLRGAECDARSDLFSLGTVLYYLCTGQLPFAGHNPHQALARVIEGDYPDPLRLRPEIGADLSNILHRLLCSNPAERYASASELAEVLRTFLQQSGIEDADKCLRTFLADPKVAGQRLQDQTKTHLLRRAAQAVRMRDFVAARRCCDRVLAMDEGHAEALRLLRRMGARRAYRWTLWSLLFVASTVALVAGLWSAWRHRSLALPQQKESSTTPNTPANRDADTAQTDMGQPAPQLPPAQKSSRSKRQQALLPTSATARKKPAARLTKGRFKSALPESMPTPVAQTPGHRIVLLRPEPQNVRIGVDGSKARFFGPNFRSLELKPGNHRFRIEGAAGCCIDEVFSLRIPPGKTPYVLKKKLKFRPSGLYVASNVPCNVHLKQAQVHGRSRYVIWVPMTRAIEEVHQFTVSAPSYQSTVESVRLRAGQVAEVRVQLDPQQAAISP